jgi:hypothetical protein
MPADQDDRARQIEALRRYVSDLYDRGERAAAQPPRRVERPSRGWVLLAAALGVLGLAGGILIGALLWPDERPRERGRGAFSAAQPSTSAAAPQASAECAIAVQQANRSLAVAVKVESALAEHTRVMNDLLNRRIDASTALRRGNPSLVIGATESAKFDIALADYKKVVDTCRLRPR